MLLGLLAVFGQPGCGTTPGPAPGSGGVASGGVGPTTGGATGSGGTGSGGVASGGTSSGGSGGTGGQGTGGASSGGAASGGASSGGAASGGAASGGAGSGGSSGGFEPCPATGPCKILPLGDSITEGLVQIGGNYQMNGGYRVGLFQRAVDGGKDITFVGSRSNGPDTVAGQPFPKNHEGTSGITIQDLADKANKYADGPHIVLLHIGTNDLNLNQQNGVTDRLSAFIDQITDAVPDALLVVAQLVPMPSKASDLATYNASMVPLVEEKVTAGKHVILVDMFTEFPDNSLPDSIHPSVDGYDWMGGTWYDAIESYLP